jgi:membrane-associated protease RseP (regulator of RpoE activity)
VSDFFSAIIGILVLAFALAVSIGLHEIGHMWPAKKFGVKVPKYMIGFGPKLWGIKRGETEYGVRLLPLGGYVLLSGMNPPRNDQRNSRAMIWYKNMVEWARPDEDLAPEEAHRSFYRLSTWKKIVVMAGGPFMNLILGFLFAALALNVVGTWQVGNQVRSTYNCVSELSGSACESGEYVLPAAQVGLQKGDRIVEIGGQAIAKQADIKPLLEQFVGQGVEIKIERDGAVLSRTAEIKSVLVPVDSTSNRTEERPFLGVGFEFQFATQAPSETVKFATDSIVGTFNLIIHLPQQLVTSVGAIFGENERDPNGAVSIVGIADIAGDVAVQNGDDFRSTLSVWLLMLAGLNFALFAFNMIPVLPLDGGHILIALLSKVKAIGNRIRKRPDTGPIDLALFAPLTMFAWVVLMVMGITFIIADVIAPIAF